AVGCPGRRCAAAPRRAAFFFAGDAEFLQGPANGSQGATQVQALTDLVERQVGLLGEELAEFVVACFRDGRRSAPGIGTWPERGGFGAEAEVVGDTIDRDGAAR